MREDVNEGALVVAAELVGSGTCKLFADVEFDEVPENAHCNLDRMIQRFIEVVISKLGEDAQKELHCTVLEAPGQEIGACKSVAHVGRFMQSLTVEMKQDRDDAALFGLHEDKWAMDMCVYASGWVETTPF